MVPSHAAARVDVWAIEHLTARNSRLCLVPQSRGRSPHGAARVTSRTNPSLLGFPDLGKMATGFRQLRLLAEMLSSRTARFSAVADSESEMIQHFCYSHCFLDFFQQVDVCCICARMA